jgi:hypothetical protein
MQASIKQPVDALIHVLYRSLVTSNSEPDLLPREQSYTQVKCAPNETDDVRECNERENESEICLRTAHIGLLLEDVGLHSATEDEDQEQPIRDHPEQEYVRPHIRIAECIISLPSI